LANLSDESEEGISLFPMFNILACTLGVMIFILATVATVSLGADMAVEVLMDAGISLGAQRKTPTWVEWDGSELALYPSMDRVRFDRDLREIPTWDETYAYVSATLGGTRVGAAVAAVGLDNENQYIIVLIRPSGFASFLEVRSYFEFLGIDVGYEPIDQHWQRILVQ